ncbi:MAG: hypothetical protein A3F10_01070 [Coxiella sp. RIFCSPHIGHO2_12_FULL_42_15]|nr:MAG: hypothetical protein A3F10_01070 [Coxiella sp. RIFCSPHIGHO2_12_FULL_42_15]
MNFPYRFIRKIKNTFIQKKNELKHRWQSLRGQKRTAEIERPLISHTMKSSETLPPIRHPLSPSNSKNSVSSSLASTSPKKRIPFKQGFFGQLPPELLDKIFSELALQAPVLEIIQNKATPEQKARVVAGKAYHVIETVDSNGNRIYSHLGFAKKSTNGSICYATTLLDKNSVFYTLVIQEPARLNSMADTQAPRDTYAFYFLEQAIGAAKGIIPHLQDRTHLAGACQSLRAWMNPSQETYSLNFQKTLQEEQLEITLRHVLFGNQTAAEKQLKASPTLLLLKNTHAITDFSGKPIQNLTPFQAALCASDIEMCEMMKKIFLGMANGETPMKEQFYEIFPDGDVEAKLKEQKENVFDFNEIADVIIRSTNMEITAARNNTDNSSLLCGALRRFRKAFEEKSDSEQMFNAFHLIEAVRIYSERINRIAHLEQAELFCTQVLAFIQRYVPACYAQAFAQSLYELVDGKKPLQRSFKFKGRSDTIHLSSRSSCTGIGFHYHGFLYEPFVILPWFNITLGARSPRANRFSRALQSILVDKYSQLWTLIPKSAPSAPYRLDS